MPLTHLVYKKVKGNPFFTRQFLQALYTVGLIMFDSKAGYWQYDLAQLSTLEMSGDVVALIVVQLQKLPPETIEVLQLAACIGNKFDQETLSIVRNLTGEETAADLWPAMRAGWVTPQSKVYPFFPNHESVSGPFPLAQAYVHVLAYRFLHDRV